MASVDDKPSPLERARRNRVHQDEVSMWNWSNFNPDLVDEAFGSDEIQLEARKDDPVVIQCWKFSETDCFSQEPDHSVRSLKEDDIHEWLAQSPPTREGRGPTSGLRLIHGYISIEGNVLFREETIEAINHLFGLPSIQLHRASCLSGSCGRFTSEDSKPVFVCSRTQGIFTTTTVVKHDFETSITVGYILSSNSSQIHSTLLGIPSQYYLYPHPLIAPLLMVEYTLERLALMVGRMSVLLGEVEYDTGYNNYSNAYRKYRTSNFVPNKDFQRTAKELGGLSTAFVFNRTMLEGVKLNHEFLLQELTSQQSWMLPHKCQDYQKITTRLIERARYTSSQAAHLEILDGLEGRLQAQQSALFNFMTQEDSKANIRLANEMRQIALKAKRDSSVMKIIAFLGTIFLPATFVSTLFAMPLFNWEASSTRDIPGQHFWIYWAVTGPLTLVTTAVVAFYILSRKRKSDSEKRELVDESRDKENK